MNIKLDKSFRKPTILNYGPAALRLNGQCTVDEIRGSGGQNLAFSSYNRLVVQCAVGTNYNVAQLINAQ